MKKMKLKLKIAISLLLFFGMTSLFAQDGAGRQTKNQKKLAVVGYATANFRSVSGGGSGWVSSTYNPIFVYKPTDKLSFNAELEIVVEDPQAWDGALALEFAELAYELNDNVTFYAGKFLSPIGAYQERYHPAWINKSINGPLAIMNDVNGVKRLQGDSEIGFGFKGGFYSGDLRVNYNVFMTNGPSLNSDGSVNWDGVGMDNNNSPAIGGRIGILPFKNSTFELGFSGYSGKAGDKVDYTGAKVTLFAFDLNYVKQTDAGKFDIKGQYDSQKVSDETYPNTLVPNQAFKNSTSASFLQFAYRLPESKLELVSRVANFKIPNNVTWGANQTALTIGVNYWLNWNAVFKFGYDNVKNGDNTFGFTFAMGL